MRTLLVVCLALALTSCNETSRDKARVRVQSAREKVSKAKENLKEKAKELKTRASPVLELSPAEFNEHFAATLVELKRYDEGLTNLRVYAKTRPELFPNDKVKVALAESQRQELRQIWRGTLDYMRALDAIKNYWRGVHMINPVKRPEDHRRAFMIAYLTWAIQYHHGLMFIDMSVPSKTLEVLLDEPARDIPERSFAALKQNILSVKAITQFLGSHQYWRLQRKPLETGECARDAACRWGLDRLLQYKEKTLAQLESRASAVQYSYNAFDVVRDASFGAWFPVQKEVAEWMGDTKIRRFHSHLISGALRAKLVQGAEPGDIIISRKNWYLSNVGLPGFWPHAALYFGTPEQMIAFFADANLSATLPELGGKSLPEHLKATYPDAWNAYNAKNKAGDAMIVLEAMSEGVLFTPPGVALAADYVALLRPKRAKVDRARALLRAFQHHGKPYDFDFDFVSDASIVCTELVYKAWQRGPGHNGLSIDLVKVMGRPTLPANELMRQFALDLKNPPEARQFEFVAFLDGLEKAHVAQWGNEGSLAATWKRPQWDWAQK